MADGNGISPIDPTSLIGQVRLALGDDTPDANGDFTFSDDAIDAALARGGDSVPRACGTLIKKLALQATMAGQSIKASDFAINTTNRGKDLLAIAQSYFDEADAQDALDGAGEMTIVTRKSIRQRPMPGENLLPYWMLSPVLLEVGFGGYVPEEVDGDFSDNGFGPY